MSDQPLEEAVQRRIAEGMGITWDAYAARAEKGVQVAQATQDWPSGWARLKFAWRPNDGLNRKAEVSPETIRYAEELRLADLAKNAVILASIPKTEANPVPHPMSDAVQAAHVKEEMAVKFLSPRCMAVLGMRGYKPVINAKGNPVRLK